MNIIVCLGENGGMFFNKRRQSKDQAVMADLMSITKESNVWMNENSASLFEEYGISGMHVDEQFLEKAKEGEYAFVESDQLDDYLDRIESFVIYYWNRDYPADMYFKNYYLRCFELSEKRDFAGLSHNQITRAIYLHDQRKEI